MTYRLLIRRSEHLRPFKRLHGRRQSLDILAYAPRGTQRPRGEDEIVDVAARAVVLLVQVRDVLVYHRVEFGDRPQFAVLQEAAVIPQPRVIEQSFQHPGMMPLLGLDQQVRKISENSADGAAQYRELVPFNVDLDKPMFL